MIDEYHFLSVVTRVRTEYTDSADCLLTLLSISVFHFLVVGSVR